MKTLEQIEERSLPPLPRADFGDNGRVKRQRVAVPVLLRRPGAAFAVRSMTYEIGSGGFYCISDEPFCPHEKLECELVIPRANIGFGFPLKGDGVLRCRVEVVRIVINGTHPGFGVECRLESLGSARPAAGFTRS